MSAVVATRIGKQSPRIATVPAGALSSRAARDVIGMADTAGFSLDPWQRWVVEQGLSQTDAGKWSAFESCLVVPRQCGKSAIFEAMILAALFVWEERTVVYSAHRFDTAQETFTRLRQLVEESFGDEVKKIYTANGKESIILRSGCRVTFKARSRGSGRGFSGDRMLFDEAYDLPAKALGAMIPSMAARSMEPNTNPQIWYASSAPHVDSLVLHGRRERAVSDNPGKLFYAEWSCERDADVDDRDNWYQANPALGIRIAEEFIEDELNSLRSFPDEFRRERLGIGDLPQAEARPVKLPAAAWAATVGPDLPATESPTVLTFDASRDGEWSTVAIAAGTMSSPYVEVIAHRQGVGWLPSFLVDKVRSIGPVVVGVNGAGPAGAQVGPVLAAFADAGIEQALLKQLSTTEYKQACGGFYTDVVEGRLRRPDQGADGKRSPLDIAASDATERPLGDAWAWDFRNATVPISPLVAVTVARSLLPAKDTTPPVRPLFKFS